ncbi:MAG: bifunctional 3,4-dihydroxy-2-butanone-4-phosphate synthase/GTP cyclohydrolase II [Chitinophagales bacterium]
MKLNSIEEALLDIQKGKLVIVVDDENRENEGDFIGAAEHVTPEMVNFMATHGRGLICTPITEARAKSLELELMVGKNTVLHETQFTVSIDLIGDGCTTGISAQDRAKTIKSLTSPETKPKDLGRPGHIFPLIAREGGVLRRSGHTEAAVDLAKLAGCEPVGILVEILNEDGTMARLPELVKIADKHNLKIISIEDLIEYRLNHDSLVKKEVTVNMPTKFGDFELHAFSQNTSPDIHMALTKGNWSSDEPVMVRVHSSCATGDILHSLRCDCGEQLDLAMKMVEAEGKGIILYMQQEGRGIGLLNKLKAYKLQETGIDTVDANTQLGFQMDERDYGIGAQILRRLNIEKIRLISNNPKKRVGLIGYGLEIVENIAIHVPPNKHNQHYLDTKREKMGHTI